MRITIVRIIGDVPVDEGQIIRDIMYDQCESTSVAIDMHSCKLLQLICVTFFFSFFLC